MANYTKTTDFAAKDSLPSGDSNKIIRGSEFETEFDAISTAIATKANANNTALTGSGTAENLSVSGTLTAVAVDINSGAVDGTTIGSASASSGAFTTLSASGDLAVDTDTLFVDVSSGNVGIGTTNPAEKLDVNGDATIGDITGSGTLNIRKKFDETATLNFQRTTAGLPVDASISCDVNENLILSWADILTTPALLFKAQGSEVARITPNGSVGIGTNNPLEALHVSGNAYIRNVGDTNLYVSSGNTTGTAGIQFGDSDALFRGKIEYDNSTETLALSSNGYTPDDVVINSSGNVGIGTSSPSFKLEIDNQADNAFIHLVRGAGNSFIALGLDGSDAIITAGTAVAAEPRNLTFRTATSSGVEVERMRIDDNGNVGIGTSSPSSKLQVTAGSVDAVSADVSGVVSEIRLGSTTTGQGNAYTEYDRTSGKLQTFIGPKGSEVFSYAIDSVGQIGIGESTPLASLHISKPAPSIRIEDSNSSIGSQSTGKIEFTTNTGVPQVTLEKLENSLDFLFKNGVNGDFIFSGNSSGGNVGIGTSSPASIVGGTDTNPVLSIGGSDSSIVEGDKAGSVSFITNDTSYTTIFADGVAAEIAAVGEGNFGSAYGLAFYTGTIGGSPDRGERVRIDREGNVGIGTSSPAADLEVASAANTKLRISDSTNVNQRLDLDHNAGFSSITSGNNGAKGVLAFYQNDGTTVTEAARIDASGNLFVAKTSSGIGTVGHQIQANGLAQHTVDGAEALQLNRLTNDGIIAQFRKDSTVVGSVSVTSTTTVYNTSSDVRLKENITDAPAGTVDALQVRSFDWKADGSHQEYGFVAQELEPVAPYAVTKGETDDDMWSVDYSKLVPMLVKEIQDLKARVATLEAI